MERVVGEINYRDQILPVRPSDLFLMVDLMSFEIQERKTAPEASIQVAVLIFAHLKVGEDIQKSKAKALINESVEWDLTQDFAVSLQCKNFCAELLLRYLKQNNPVIVP